MLEDALNDFLGRRVPEVLLEAQSRDKVYMELMDRAQEASAKLRRLAGKDMQLERAVEVFEEVLYTLVSVGAEMGYRAGLKDAKMIQNELFLDDTKPIS